MIEYTDEQHDSLIRAHRKQLADAQATVEALQAQLVTLKRHADLDCGDQSCLYAMNHGGMRTNGGCRCNPKRMKEDLQRAQTALDAEREKVKRLSTCGTDHSTPWWQVRCEDLEEQLSQLQALVRELEEWKRIVTGAGTDQESVIRLAAHEYTKTAIQCWKEANAKLESQLTQRTAELEALNKLLYKKNCELGRFETIISDLQAELERVRSLVEALPKVEGEIRLIHADDGDWHVVDLYDAIFTDKSWAVSYAALLQHRQGMEG